MFRGALLLALFAVLAQAAEPLEQIKGVSGIESPDARKLLSGEVLSARGTQGSFARGVYGESLYYLRAPLATARETLLHWNPEKYKESEVSRYATYVWPAPAGFFKPFQPEPARGADRFFIDALATVRARGTPGELHLSPAEATLLQKGAAWPALLAGRSEAMAAGGLVAVPEYRAGDATINARQEYRNLLGMAPRLAAHFEPLVEITSALGMGGSAPTGEVVPYVEESLVRGHTSWCLGVMTGLENSVGWQMIDCTYYSADTYFMSISLYQLWPWSGGTLVWQVSYISAPFRPYLAHVDKVFAGREMAKDNAKSVQLLRLELEERGR